jgi:hypothetical protein
MRTLRVTQWRRVQESNSNPVLSRASARRPGFYPLLTGPKAWRWAMGISSPAASRDLDRRIAVLEAGHCIAAVLVGLPVVSVTVENVGGFAGLTSFGDGRADVAGDTTDLCTALARLMPRLGESRDAVAADLTRCADIVVISLAGIEAERLIIGTTLPNTGHDPDEAAAIAALLCRSPASVGAFVAFARAEASMFGASLAGSIAKIAESDAIGEKLAKIKQSLDVLTFDEDIEIVKRVAFECGQAAERFEKWQTAFSDPKRKVINLKEVAP